MTLFVMGLNHKTAPVELRERFAVPASDLVSRATLLKSRCDLQEIVVLSTCNRVEIYATTSHQPSRTSSLLQTLCSTSCNICPNAYVHEHFQAARHLFRVASGLDSMVLGETEITCQVKKAYESALGAKLTGRVLNRVFQAALQVTKEIRTRTCIGRGSTSVGGVATQLAEKIFSCDLSRQSIMIIGAGKMGEACVRHLARKGVRSILVANRSFDRAVQLAGEFRGQALPIEHSLGALLDVDIVVASTGLPRVLLARSDVEKAMKTRRNRPLVLIDISVPRNIDPKIQNLENVYLYNIDDLEAIVRENTRARCREAALCDLIIEERAKAVIEKLGSGHQGFQRLECRFQPLWGYQGATASIT